LNVVIYKPATAGYEAHTPVILQGHMDMVCVQEPGHNHDFEKEGLELQLDGEWLTANKTTLGADDGIAIAYSLALLSDETISHPALEVVITTDEETGRDGAKALDCSILKGRNMINIDSEEEGNVLVSCAGGMRFSSELPLTPMEAEGTVLHVVADGLKGGHSGQEIDKNRTNAILLLARALNQLKESYDFLLIQMAGGDKDNAIPSFAECEILVKDEDAEKVLKALEDMNQVYHKELMAAEPNVKLTANSDGHKAITAIHPTQASKILFALMTTPNGIQTMSSTIPGLVESSLNLGIFDATGDTAVFHYSLRSSVSSYKYFMRDKLTMLFEFLQADTEGYSEYPAWEYKAESEFRDTFVKVFEQEYGHKPELTAIHAGLECGLISEKIPDIDIVSIGPDMQDIHSPKERLNIPSAIRVYKFLEKLLEVLK
ncbi:MAG: beta-Ala-His dipeptidase, partial [Clostridiales bacterium]|nr:beta-Ala-His dipeptidase [Clostridiales bacterium]